MSAKGPQCRWEPTFYDCDKTDPVLPRPPKHTFPVFNQENDRYSLKFPTFPSKRTHTPLVLSTAKQESIYGQTRE